MDTVTIALIYLATSIVFFAGIVFFNRKKLKNRRQKNRNIIIVKYAVFSLLYAILIPIMVIGLESGIPPAIGSLSVSDGVENSEYGKSMQYDGDMIAIAVILLIFFAFVGLIYLMAR